MDPDACQTVTESDEAGLEQDPQIRQQERLSGYYPEYLERRRPDESFREYLQRCIVYIHHRKQFPPPMGGPKARKEYELLVRHFKTLYGAGAFIRYWRSNPPPPRNPI